MGAKNALALRGAVFGLVCAAWPAAAIAEEAHRIESVTLSSGGLAEIRRSARVEGTSRLSFTVPLEQVDDILKSLLVRDAAGGAASLVLDGLSPVDETFRLLPFSPSEMNALPSLLRALQGVPVRASSGGRAVEGTVLGVSAETGEAGEEAEAILSVMGEDGRIVVLRLGADAEVEILDPQMRERVREAAAVSGRGRTDGTRAITLFLEGGGEREIGLDYVVPAPVWKTAYRLVLDGDEHVRLQAWAVIENASGEDWSDVAVTLTSGAPVTLAQRLHQRYWHQRPEVPVMAQAAVPPRPDQFRGSAADQAAVAEDSIMAYRGAPLAAAPMMPEPAPPPEVWAGEGETAAVYRLPGRIDLPVGRTLSVPFIDAELPVERIVLFQPERGEVHPVTAIVLENTTPASLPPGIVTVYAETGEGYAGDAELHALPAGESRMLSFAADRRVEITTQRAPDRIVYRASLVDGVLRASRITRAVTTYGIEGAEDGARTVVIEHPRREGWRFSSDALEASTPTHHRLRADVPEAGRIEVEAVAERTETESVALVDADAPTLLQWSGRIEDAATAETLAELADRRQAIARAQAEVEELERDIERAAQSQARVRDNLGAVPPESALAQRYVAMLEEEEDRLAELAEHRRLAEERLTELRDDFAGFIRDL